MIFILFSTLFRRDFITKRNQYDLNNLVQVHHIIPMQWKNHANLKFIKDDELIYYDVKKGYNLILLPTKSGKKKLKTKRRIHDGSHNYYNTYVKELLDSDIDPFDIMLFLRYSLMNNNEDIPW